MKANKPETSLFVVGNLHKEVQTMHSECQIHGNVQALNACVCVQFGIIDTMLNLNI